MKKELIQSNGKKIRDIQIDKQKHLLELGLLIMLFNIFLVVAVVRLGTYIERWYIWLINGIITIYCLVHSVITFLREIKRNKYQIYENSIVVNSIWYATEIELKDITRLEVKRTIFDKMSTKKTCSLAIEVGDEHKQRVVLHRITEDIHNLITEIDKMKQIQEHKQKNED